MKALLFRSLALAALLSVNLSATAQFFTPPVAANTVFPTAPALILRPETSSSYSINNVSSPFGTAALYLSGWSGFAGANGFSWRFTNPANPMALLGQGTFSYPNGRDIEVGFVDAPGGQQILVAYYEAGVGHMLDVYNVLPFVSLAYTMPLSASPVYGRISMDCHLTYGVAIAWDNPSTNSIEAIAGQNGSWGPVTALPPHPSGAASEVPDVAFSHSNGPLNIHIVTHTPAANDLMESVISWPDLLIGSLASYAIQDNNLVPSTPNIPIRPVINCPDHFNVENWAYTYTYDDSRIEVRFIDYNTLGTPLTSVVNAGGPPLGNVGTIANYRNRMPSLAHSTNGDIYVAWYAAGATASLGNQYIALQMTADGNTLLSNPDYMLIPNSNTPFAYPLAPGISLSKMNDLNPQFLYAAYYDLNTAGTYQMHHAWHVWPNLVFKGTGSSTDWRAQHPECSQEATTASALASRISVRVSPNPFTDVVHTAFTTDKSGTALLQVTDLTGKVVDQASYPVEKGAHSFNTGSLKNLASGTYLLNVSLDGTRIGQQKVVKF